MVEHACLLRKHVHTTATARGWRWGAGAYWGNRGCQTRVGALWRLVSRALVTALVTNLHPQNADADADAGAGRGA
eukprot:6559716-Lingulodinium_polyedra.AAC.1